MQNSATCLLELPGGVPRESARRRVLVRLAGEIGTKARATRRRFLRRLTLNVERALGSSGLEARVHQEWSRLLVDADDCGAARRALARVFGVHSAAEVVEVGFTSLEQLVDSLVPLYGPRVEGRSFAVRARGQSKLGFGWRELAVVLGAALRPLAERVDLEQPEVEVPVMLEGERAFAVLEVTSGPGGLPLGVGGTAVALLSGGFDSPVAAWQVMSRGVGVELLICDLGGCGQVEQVLSVAGTLAAEWAPGWGLRAHVVDLTPVVSALLERVPGRLRQLLLKRAMYRVADRLAREVGGEAIVTGESLGQVSTQTLRNLAVCERAIELPVLRPLAGMGKEEILRRAREIGTYEASSRVVEHCSIAGGRVLTWASPELVESVERDLLDTVGGLAWVEAALEGRRVLRLPAEQPGPSRRPDWIVDSVPPGALVVDVREMGEGTPVGDLQIPFSRARELLDRFDPARTYVLVCASGRRSEALAAWLRERGIAAFSLAGGAGRLA